MNYGDLLAALRQRWKLVAATVGLSLLIVGIGTLVGPRSYAASATLLFDTGDAGVDPATGDAGSVAPQATILGTQADIIRSTTVARQVAETLRLDRDPETQARWRGSTGGAGDIRDWLADALLAGLAVAPTKNSNVLAVRFVSDDPERAATVANGFADAFVGMQLRLRTEPAKVYSDWFGARIADARAKLERAQSRLTTFQQRRGLVGSEKIDLEMAHLSDLTGQLAIAEAAAAESGARARHGGSRASEVQMSATVAALRSAAALKAAEVDQLRATLGPNHPQLLTANAALAALRSKLADAIGQATQTLNAASAAGAGRVGELRARTQAQREQVLRVAALQDELQVLQRDVNSAKADYDGVMESLNAARLRAQIPQTNVSILDRAHPPRFPFSPDVRLRLFLALSFGALLGLGLALAAEWRNPRVRTASGLAQRTGVPAVPDDSPVATAGFAGASA